MKKTALLQKYILEPEILVMPGAHDVLSARIIEKAGFKALAVGGYSATACLLGKPDLSFLTLTEMGDHIARLTGAVNLPALVDGDTGHGGVLNVGRTVKELERAGAAGIFIEDQVFPKRCGHMEGKQVVGWEDMVAKIKAALDARSDPDFVIMARTDALAVLGLDEAGKTPFLPAQELEAIGYNAVVFPVSATYALAKAVSALMAELSRTGTTKGFWDQMWQFDDFYQFMGVDALRQKERNYHERGLAAVAVEQLQSKQVFSRSKSKRRRKS